MFCYIYIQPASMLCQSFSSEGKERSTFVKVRGISLTVNISKSWPNWIVPKVVFMSTTTISILVLQKVDGTKILPLTFIKDLAFPDSGILLTHIAKHPKNLQLEDSGNGFSLQS